MSNHENLTVSLKAYSRGLGADLIGVAPVSRWEHAPIEHSPQGIMPAARSVIVSGVHFLDATTELAGEPDPRQPGPGRTEMNAGTLLDYLAFRQTRYLERLGWQALFVPTTLYWNYRRAPGADRGWAGDICHYYAAAAAGLGEIGWHNLCITPEFGTRQRFVTVVTDAPLAADPLYSGPALCDKCLLCARHCPTKCFEKEVRGMCSVRIEDKEFTFPDRNLWRCAIGENFEMDVFMDLPETVDEKFIIETKEKAALEQQQLIYGWKMGMCLKHCVPPQRRYFDKAYCKAPRRRRDVVPDGSPDAVRSLMAEVSAMAARLGVDVLAAAGSETFDAAGLDLRSFMPDAASALVIGLAHPPQASLNTGSVAERVELLLGKRLQEAGFSALTKSDIDPEAAALACGAARHDGAGRVAHDTHGTDIVWRVIILSAPLPENLLQDFRPPLRHQPGNAVSLTEALRVLALEEGADLFGVAPAARLEAVAHALEPLATAEKDYFVVKDIKWGVTIANIHGGQAMPYNPRAEKVVLKPHRPSDYLPNAASAIVIGLGLPHGSVDHAGTPPAYQAGHFQKAVHDEAVNQMAGIMLRLAKYLHAHGHAAVPAFNSDGLASGVYGGSSGDTAASRLAAIAAGQGEVAYGGTSGDLTESRFAALAAGLADLGLSGLALTPQFGARQRFAVLFTDAPLQYDDVYSGPRLCRECRSCVSSCPVDALKSETNSISIDGREFKWAALDRLRCDCAKLYALTADEGPKFMGSTNDFELPEKITPEFVCQAMRESDRLQHPRYCSIVEPCFTVCPAHIPETR